MDLLRSVLIYSYWTFILFGIANCLTCGQTKCSDGEHCCSRDKEGSKDCCCKTSPSGGFSQHCYSASGTSVSFPVWAVVLIVVGVIGIIVTVVFILYRRRKRQTFQQM